MQSINDILAEISALPEVYSAKIWEGRRIYVNIAGRDTAKAGDRNAKVYWDSKTGWHIDGLKGAMSGTFSANIRRFASVYCRSAFWME